MSAKPVYEQIKDVLGQQKLTAQVLDVKAIGLWAGITTIPGIAIPLGFSRITADTLWLAYLTIVPLFLYVLILVFVFPFLTPKAFSTQNNPRMADLFNRSSDQEFYEEMIRRISQSFQGNEEMLQPKRMGVKILGGLVAVEFLCLILWSMTVLYFTPVLNP